MAARPLTHLIEYARSHEDRLKPTWVFSRQGRWVLAGAYFAMAGFLWLDQGWRIALGWTICAWPAVLFLAWTVDEAMMKPRSRPELVRWNALRILHRMQSGFGARRNLYPPVGLLLEACALHRARVLEAVEPPERRMLLGTLAGEAVRAVDEVMVAAIVRSDRYIGFGHGASFGVVQPSEAAFLDRMAGLVEEVASLNRREPDDTAGALFTIPSRFRPIFEVALALQRLSWELTFSFDQPTPETEAAKSRVQSVIAEIDRFLLPVSLSPR